MFRKIGFSILSLICVNIAEVYADTASTPLQKLCEEIDRSTKALKWDVKPCMETDWKIGGTSFQGRPLIYAEFGNPKAPNTTLIFSTVHGDEVTPLYLGLMLPHWLNERKEQLANSHVVIAPLVNPDGFFVQPRTRMNARGVDVNRNFATSDWQKSALEMWKRKYRKDKRRFPGDQPMSEPETLFQDHLIKQVKPQKILSIHSPLNMMDYDGPSALSLSKFPTEYMKECDRLKKSLKAISSGFFPGSLGNYAGRELGIPTLTLELPSANPRKAHQYWEKFSQGIQTMIQFTVPSYASGQLHGPNGS